MLTKNSIFGPLLLVKGHSRTCGSDGLGVETKCASVAQGQKCNVTSVNRVDLLQVWDDMQEV